MGTQQMKVNETVRVPEAACLSCGKPNTAATGVDEAHEPLPGAITVCMYCGHIMAFSDTMTMRELTSEEAKDVAGDPRILAIQRARANMERDKARKK